MWATTFGGQYKGIILGAHFRKPIWDVILCNLFGDRFLDQSLGTSFLGLMSATHFWGPYRGTFYGSILGTNFRDLSMGNILKTHFKGPILAA